MTIELKGNWKKGFAFDVHTLDSVYLGTDEYGHDRWENTRSDMGELVYQLKYRGDQNCLPKIISLLEKIKGVETMDCIVPIPPTNPTRERQPVSQIAEALGKRHDVSVITDLLSKKPGSPELKNITDPEERRKLLKESMMLSNKYNIAGMKILLVDDLFRSGATLSVATDLLMEDGHAASITVLTMTKTRSNR